MESTKGLQFTGRLRKIICGQFWLNSVLNIVAAAHLSPPAPWQSCAHVPETTSHSCGKQDGQKAFFSLQISWICTSNQKEG